MRPVTSRRHTHEPAAPTPTRDRAAPRSTAARRRRRSHRRDPRLAASGCSARWASASTTMSRIAAEVGLRAVVALLLLPQQGRVLAALVARANVVPLELIDGIERRPAARRVRSSTASCAATSSALCALPFDINEIHRWRPATATLRRLLARASPPASAASPASCARASATGEFRAVDARLTALTIMSNDEGVQNWYRLRHGRAAAARSARSLADLTVGGLLAPRRQPRRRRRAKWPTLLERHDSPADFRQRASKRSRSVRRSGNVAETARSVRSPRSSPRPWRSRPVRSRSRRDTVRRPTADRGVGARGARRCSPGLRRPMRRQRGPGRQRDRRRPRLGERRQRATCTIGYSAWPGWFPLAVADKQGIFAEAGLKST